jgi:hypothetical protein
MAKNLGTYVFAANFQVKAAEALDPRMVAASKADLINKANWPSDGDEIYVYKGLIVDCGEDGVYRLIDPAKALATDYSGWERIDAGGVKIDNIFTYKGEVESYSALPLINEIGDVYNVASAFSIGEGEAKKDYPAGTNVAWNGETWDPLAGSVDLSAYATKTEVSEIRINVGTNTTAISNLSTALGQTNEAVAKKVDAVDGYSLISDEKLALIDTNAAEIQALEDKNLDSRISTLEGMFKSEDGTIDLSDITNTLNGHSTRIGNLESGKVDKETFNTLSGTVSEIQGTLAEAVALNAEQTGYINSLQESVTTLTNTYNSGIQGLTTTVNSHTESIAKNTTDLSALTAVVDTIKGDYLKAADIEGKLDASVYEAKVAELVKADEDNLQAAKDHADTAAGLVSTALAEEVARAKAAEQAVAEAVQAEAARIDALLTSEGVSEAVESFKELQAWIENHEGGAADILAAANKAQEEVDALELVVAGIDEAYKAADAATLTAAKEYVDGELTKLGTAATKDIEYFASATALASVKATADAAAPQATTYTKDEVDSNIGAAITDAFTWINVQ